jgi:hypothetical protein
LSLNTQMQVLKLFIASAQRQRLSNLILFMYIIYITRLSRNIKRINRFRQICGATKSSSIPFKNNKDVKCEREIFQHCK